MSILKITFRRVPRCWDLTSFDICWAWRILLNAFGIPQASEEDKTANMTFVVRDFNDSMLICLILWLSGPVPTSGMIFIEPLPGWNGIITSIELRFFVFTKPMLYVKVTYQPYYFKIDILISGTEEDMMSASIRVCVYGISLDNLK